MRPRRRRWTVIVPLKGGPGAKSRLGGPPELAAALALDTLEAVVGTPGVATVLVVTSDDATADAARRLGARVIVEAAPGSGLLPAIRDGLTAAADAPVAVLLGDLPALRPTDLDAALDACLRALRGAPAALVPDAEGSGSVLLAGHRPADLDPAFGPGSAAEHVRRGAVRLDLDLPRLRHDVDTPADLVAALTLGTGTRTRACTADAGCHARR